MASESDFEIILEGMSQEGLHVKKRLTPQEYFDPPDPGEELTYDSAPNYLKLTDYFDEFESPIWVRSSVRDNRINRCRVLEERFWGRGCDYSASLMQDFEGERLVDWEHVIYLQDKGSDRAHVVRVGTPTDQEPAGIRSHIVVTIRKDGDLVESMLPWRNKSQRDKDKT
jgi:hypothetical protein